MKKIITSKTEYDTFSCKNQENIYKSRAKASSNVTIIDEGITVKNVISDELSNEIIKGFKIIQNKLHYAITGHTAAELIYERVD